MGKGLRGSAGQGTPHQQDRADAATALWTADGDPSCHRPNLPPQAAAPDPSAVDGDAPVPWQRAHTPSPMQAVQSTITPPLTYFPFPWQVGHSPEPPHVGQGAPCHASSDGTSLIVHSLLKHAAGTSAVRVRNRQMELATPSGPPQLRPPCRARAQAAPAVPP